MQKCQKNYVQTGTSNNSLMALRRDSDKVLELTQYWTPPVPPWQPLKKTLNSSLRMACVVEDRMYQGFRFEGEVMLLTPANWKHVLRYGQPDFLLMESIWISATGHWHMGQGPKAPGRDELLEIISLANKLSIPSIFWITKGHEYHEHYKDFARQFDYVFCADPKEAELLRSEGIKVDELLPCVQPALYNPFRHYEHYDAFRLDNLYDGWADLDRITDDLRVLKEVKPYGLDIIESRNQIFRQRMGVLPEYKECILGCVSEQSRMQALRYAKAYITFEKSLSTRTTQQWMALEAAACRLPVVHHGSLPENDVRKGVVVECPEQIDFLVEFVRFREDDLYRERVAHLGWRKIYQEHTFAHRMQKICKTIGIKHDWEEYPKASLVTPTFRREFLHNCMKNYEQQIYSNKELIVVFNSQETLSYSELGLRESRKDVKITNVPGEMFAGACLNQGHLLAAGEYFFRVDDDDYYGPNYILDMILQARCIDADFFGKPPAHVIFQGDPNVYGRKVFPPLMIVGLDVLGKGDIWLGGNSFAGRRSFFTRVKYFESSYGAADSSLLLSLTEDQGRYNITFMDNMNLVSERRSDPKSHTWKVDIEKLKKSCFKIGSLQDVFV